ncbi:MAG TPA: hypothetical protein VJ205_04525, partial [Gammaproteobacteria bacterium]|nr:hypothetical protein [Gammaproteobacteria bacterium]
AVLGAGFTSLLFSGSFPLTILSGIMGAIGGHILNNNRPQWTTSLNKRVYQFQNADSTQPPVATTFKTTSTWTPSHSSSSSERSLADSLLEPRFAHAASTGKRSRKGM